MLYIRLENNPINVKDDTQNLCAYYTNLINKIKKK